MKIRNSLLIICLGLSITNTYSFFTVWNREEYREWAKPDDQGYKVLFIKKEPNLKYLCALARLIPQENELPHFEIDDEQLFESEQEAIKFIQHFDKEATIDFSKKGGNNPWIWFQTWNLPGYQEFAQAIPEGYLLNIFCAGKKHFYLVQAKLTMNRHGAPDFEIITEQKTSSEIDARHLFENLFKTNETIK